jgi:hypothetical protein
MLINVVCTVCTVYSTGILLVLYGAPVGTLMNRLAIVPIAATDTPKTCRHQSAST